MPAKRSKAAAAKKPVPKKKPAATSKPRPKRVVAASGGGATEANKALVRRLLEHGLATEARANPEILHEYFADYFIDHVPVHHEKQGVHGVKEAVTEVHESTQAFHMQVTHLVAEGDWVAAHWQATSTRHRPLEIHRQLKGVEPGEPNRTAAGVTLFRLEGGKIVESWNYDNALEVAMRSKASSA